MDCFHLVPYLVFTLWYIILNKKKQTVLKKNSLLHVNKEIIQFPDFGKILIKFKSSWSFFCLFGSI